MPAAGVHGLAVILLVSEQPDRTAAFYRDVLGLPLEAERHDGSRTHYACQTGSVHVVIEHPGDLPDRQLEHGSDSIQLCFTVTDMDQFQARLQQAHVRPDHPPRRFQHTTFTTVRDPDGRPVRVMTPWREP